MQGRGDDCPVTDVSAEQRPDGEIRLREDGFLKGALRLAQPDSGYRFSIDAVLLSAFVRIKDGERVVDLGTGCGIIALIINHWHAPDVVYGVEIQPELARLARRNVRENSVDRTVRIVEADMTSPMLLRTIKAVDVVVCNPPYRRVGSGRINPDDQRAAARHEIHITLDKLLQTAKQMLRTAGRFVIIYPASRLSDLMASMRAHGIEPKQLRFVHSRRGDPARLVLAAGTRNARSGLQVDPPLYIYKKAGLYTGEVAAYFG
jgi:tRNA1Val (adenine37-N6)-methyltransferase